MAFCIVMVVLLEFGAGDETILSASTYGMSGTYTRQPNDMPIQKNVYNIFLFGYVYCNVCVFLGYYSALIPPLGSLMLLGAFANDMFVVRNLSGLFVVGFILLGLLRVASACDLWFRYVDTKK